MSNETLSRTYDTVRTVITVSQLAIIQEVASEMGISVTILAEAGQEYTYRSARGMAKGTVSLGRAYVSITGPADKTAFWRRVAEVEAAK